MAKRDNNYSRTSERSDFQEPENVGETLDHLEQYGKLKAKMKLEPKQINTRCIAYYDKVIQINNVIKSFGYDCLQSDEDRKLNAAHELKLKYLKSDYQTKIINMSSIVVGAVIKRFKTLYPAHYDDVFTACVLDILDKINKNKYDRTKSAFHSYMYESSYQACVKFLDDKVKYENSTVSLIQD